MFSMRSQKIFSFSAGKTVIMAYPNAQTANPASIQRMLLRAGAGCLRPNRMAITDAMTAFEIRMTTNTIHCVPKKDQASCEKNDGETPSDEFYYVVGEFLTAQI